MFSNLMFASTYLVGFLFYGCTLTIFAMISISVLLKLSKGLYHATLRYETIDSTATITALECEEGSALFGDDYFVHLVCAGKEYRLCDEDLYHASLVDDTITVQIHKGYNRYNKPVYEYITKH